MRQSGAVAWTEAEDAKLRAEYPTEGPSLFIRGKSRAAVRCRAQVLGLQKDKVKPYAVDDEIGSWTVIEIGLRSADGKPSVRVRCACNQTVRLATESALRSGNQRSCRRCGIRRAKRARRSPVQPTLSGAQSAARRSA